MLDRNKFEIIINQIGNYFEKVKFLLFTCDWLREKTELLFYIQVDEPMKCEQKFLFRKNETKYLCEEYNEKCEESSKCDISNKFPYWLGSIIMEDDSVVRIRLACQSPCLDENIGRLLLTNNLSFFVQKMQELIVQLLKMDCETLKKQQTENERRFEASTLPWILRKARRQTCNILDKLYAPIQIDCINSLSGEYYERSECESNLLFLPKVENIDATMLMYDFRRSDSGESQIDLSYANVRWIRKLLQMAQKDLYLTFRVCMDGLEYEALGICKEKQVSRLMDVGEKEEVPYFIAKIRRHAQWDLYLGSAYIFSYKNGNYTIGAEAPDCYLIEKCRVVFGEKNNFAPVISSIRYATKQLHGTILVVLEKDTANSEMKRFSMIKAGLKNPNLNLDTISYLDANNTSLEAIENFSAIDGSIIVDIDGRIHGIGIILDGSNKIELNLARGARFNSAKKYWQYLRDKNLSGLILIVSEDGSVEILTA